MTRTARRTGGRIYRPVRITVVELKARRTLKMAFIQWVIA
jgi:hypothetical protein